MMRFNVNKHKGKFTIGVIIIAAILAYLTIKSIVFLFPYLLFLLLVILIVSKSK